VRFDPGFDVRHTNLLSRMVETWVQVPFALTAAKALNAKLCC
jgi:hypothetical protein